VCFSWNGNAELKRAVKDYIKNGGANSAAGRKYGSVIGNWCVSKVASFAGVFMNQRTFNEPLTGWKTTNATSLARMFERAISFNQNIGNFDVRKVTTLDRTFYGATAFQGKGLGTWKTGKVKSLNWTFKNSAMITDISSWSVGSVNDLRETFRNTPFSSNLCKWGNALKKANLPTAKKVNAFASTSCPAQASPSFDDAPTGPLCHICPPWQWGKRCFANGDDLYDAVGVSSS
jgi:hypothetical protein